MSCLGGEVQPRVDPFIPVPTTPRLVRRAALSSLKRTDYTRMITRRPAAPTTITAPKRMIDDVKQPSSQTFAQQFGDISAPTAREIPVRRRTFEPPAKYVSKARGRGLAKIRVDRLPRVVQVLLVVAATIAAGVCMQSLAVGEIVIGVYAVLALLFRITSRTTFIFALMALLSIVALLAWQGDGTGSDNAAVYAFLLLAVGTLSLGVEVKRGVA